MNNNLKNLQNKILELQKYNNNLDINEKKIELILDQKIKIEDKEDKNISNINPKSLRDSHRIDMLKVKNSDKKSVTKNIESMTMTTILKNYTRPFTNLNLDIQKYRNIKYNFHTGGKQIFFNNITKLLENSFFTMSSIISKPVYSITKDKVVIHLLYFLVNKNFYQTAKIKFLSLNQNNLELLCVNLSKIFQKPVEFDLVRIKKPYYDGNILANLLGRISDVNYKPLISILDNLFNKVKIQNPRRSMPESDLIIPTFLTGLKIKLGGRLLKSKIIPRQTVKITQHGSLTRSSADIITKNRYTMKNKRGTFSFTITIGHKFFKNV